MAKVQLIKHARKEWKCRKCGKVIEKGQPYYKAEINFGPTIVRCTDCKLESWEVTTSDYQLRVGELANRWRVTYGTSEDSLDEIRTEIESIMDDTQERLDNMPESLQYAPTGELLQERINTLESVRDELDCIDISELKSTAMADTAEEYGGSYYDPEEDDYDDIINHDAMPTDLQEMLSQKFEEALDEAIENAMSNLSY